MPGLTDKARDCESVFVYNDDGRRPDAGAGQYLWCGVVIATVVDDPDPQKCVYEIWGPGGEQSSVWRATCLERKPRVAADRPPAAPPPAEVLTGERLRAGVNGALARVPAPASGAGRAVAAVVRAFVPQWEVEAAAGRLTAERVRRHLCEAADLLKWSADGFALALAPKPRPEDPARGDTQG